eukprot:scaffold579_cov231-Chaetoceros_neogracile.AAC.2
MAGVQQQQSTSMRIIHVLIRVRPYSNVSSAELLISQKRREERREKERERKGERNGIRERVG